MLTLTTNKPPKSLDDLGAVASNWADLDTIDKYVKDYRAGRAAARSGSSNTAWHNAFGYTNAYEDGFLDYVNDRDMWHLAYCDRHDNTPDGCGVA